MNNCILLTFLNIFIVHLSRLTVNMSKRMEVKVLTHGEVQKKILEKPPKARAKEELIGLGNKYRDENFETYNSKKNKFLKACKKFNRLNEEALISNKKRLVEDYKDLMNFDFLEEEEKILEETTTTGKLARKRTERVIHQVPLQSNKPCIIEPWFARYLKLNKFIWAARTVILKNRLLKVLEKLKTVTEEDIKVLEKRRTPFLNISYAEVFEKFL